MVKRLSSPNEVIISTTAPEQKDVLWLDTDDNTIDGTTNPGGPISTDTINEQTANAGVTIEGVLIKDGLVDGKDLSVLPKITSSNTPPVSPSIGDLWVDTN